jgi:Tfp pilus assembly protein PilX
MTNLHKYRSGQALLIVLLSMSVVLTIVLSVLSRSITDISVTTASEDSLRAFSAAEAGVERALIAGTSETASLDNSASFTTSVTSLSLGGQQFGFPVSLYAGDGAVIWFVSHDANGNYTCADGNCFTGTSMNVCWGKEGTASDSSTTPALEVSVVYLMSAGDYATARIYRTALDPNSSRRLVNSFSDIDAGICTIDGVNYAFQKDIDLSGLTNLQFARIRFLYNTDLTQPFGVSAGASFPSQGVKIDAIGSYGNANRRVEVVQGYPEPPFFFADAVFSQGGISK